MGRSCINIRTAVDQKGYTVFRRNQRSQRRALYALDASYDRLSADQDCSGASGGDKRVCLSAAHFFHADNDRRIFFVADRIDRRFLRLDDLSRIDNLDLFFLICMLF